MGVMMSPFISSAKTGGKRPNIIVIMCDDMGFSDIGCFGGEIATPNIDRLAKGGVKFTQFYNNAKCEPSRASLATGNYPGWKNKSETILFGPAMKAAGYRTYRVGKVHENMGKFERSCTMGGCASYWDLTQRDGSQTQLLIDGEPVPDFLKKHPDFYTTDTFTDYALKYIEEDKGSDKPFFLYAAYNAPHYPMHAWQEDIEKYRDKYLIGWDKIREDRYKKQIELGIFDKSLKMSPRDEKVPEWANLDESKKKQAAQVMAVYAAAIDRVDQNVGRILKKLKELDQEQNTLIFFLSDNGGCSKSPSKDAGAEPGPRGSWFYVKEPWANASNTPFRKYKTWNHEGGISTPLITYWPGKIKPGFDRDCGNIMDIPVTCLDIAGAKPKNIGGLSLAPAFDGGKRELHDTLCWAILKGKAARQGRWKVVRYDKEPWRLYDVVNDRTELTDLSDKYPEKSKQLIAAWEDWAKKCTYIGDGKDKKY